ncbi:MAG: GNAT family N-acetyltransferase [Actinobacteria bacterium]|nr:GNAT family N-acetyltransferase [Actinomycetota bacterium]
MELRTPRLVLRPVEPGDLDVITRINTDPELMRHIHAGVPHVPEQCRADLDAAHAHWHTHGCGSFVVRLYDGELAGLVGFNTPAWLPQALPARDIGWTILQEHQRQGYATEAAGAALDWFFDSGVGDRVVAIHTRENTRSAAVMQRLGMEWIFETRHPDYGYPLHVWETTAGPRADAPSLVGSHA